ncbi:MAG TPA: hypothetical protein VIH79_02090, partial [Candidatus Nanopelagicaceae bacterium]
GQTEQAIRTLLTQAGKTVTVAPSDLPDMTPQGVITPETYFGSNRSQFGFPIPNYPAGTFTIPNQQTVPQDQFAFAGKWLIRPEYAQAFKGSSISEHFDASNVYLILKPALGTKSRVSVTYDGKPLVGPLAGSDVVNGVITVDSDRLYNIFTSGAAVSNGTLRFTFLNDGIQAFTFTFG